MLFPAILLIWDSGMPDSSSFGAMQALACAEVTGNTWELSISKGATKRDLSSRVRDTSHSTEAHSNLNDDWKIVSFRICAILSRLRLKNRLGHALIFFAILAPNRP